MWSSIRKLDGRLTFRKFVVGPVCSTAMKKWQHIAICNIIIIIQPTSSHKPYVRVTRTHSIAELILLLLCNAAMALLTGWDWVVSSSRYYIAEVAAIQVTSHRLQVQVKSQVVVCKTQVLRSESQSQVTSHLVTGQLTPSHESLWSKYKSSCTLFRPAVVRKHGLAYSVRLRVKLKPCREPMSDIFMQGVNWITWLQVYGVEPAASALGWCFASRGQLTSHV